MSSILSNADVPSYTFNPFHSFDGFEVLGIELPKAFNQENFGNISEFASEEKGENKIRNSEVIKAVEQNYPKKNSNQSSSPIFGKDKSILEFFYDEEKEIIKFDSSIVNLEDYEIF